MHRSFRSLLVGLLAVAQPLEATAQVYDFSPTNRYFRYRVDGIDVTGVNVVVRGPTEIVVTGTLASTETRVRGGDAPFAYSIDSGSLPDGMSLNPETGAANGTVSRAGKYVFAVRATDRNGQTGVSLPYTIVVQNQKLQITRSPSLSARSGMAYNDRLEASGGRQPYAWTVAQGVLPAGIGLNRETGALTGTPAEDGQYLFRVQASDADGAVALSPEYVLFVDNTVLSMAGSAPAKGQVGTPFVGRYSAAGGHSPYSYALSGSPLPPGIALEADTGWLKGTPTAAGEYTGLRVRATDATKRSVESPYFSVSVVAPLTAAWSGGKAGTGLSYSAPVRPSGGRAPYAFALTAGTLPPGLVLGAGDGFVSGTPTSEGISRDLVVRVSDADGRVFETAPFAIEVTNDLVAVGVPARVASRGMPYSSQVTAGGGLKPYAYRMSAGTLPAGLTLDGASGAISGAPSASGLAEGLRIRITDASGHVAETEAFSISVQDPISISLADLPASVTSGDVYAGKLTAAGGKPPYSFSISRTLPQDLFLDPLTGVVSGKAGPINTFTDLVATVVDAEGRQAASPKFTIAVSNPMAVDPPVQFATVGQTYSSQVPVRGGRMPYVWSLTTSLPDGLSLDAATGFVSGTPSRIGVTNNVVLAVRDQDGRTASTAPFAFTVDPTTAVVSIPTRQILPYMIEASLPAPAVKDGTAPFKFALNKDAPSWASIDPDTGVIRANAQSSVGSYHAFQIEVTDARGRVGKSPGFSVRIVAPMTIAYATTRMTFDTDNRASYPAILKDSCGSEVWSLSSNRPSRIDIDSIGRIYTGGLYYFDVGNFPGVVVTAVDSCGVTATAEVLMDVQGGTAAIQAPGQIVVKAGSTFRTDPVLAANMASPTFSLGGAALPSFMTFDSQTGVLSGQVPADSANGATWTYGMRAEDAYGRRAFAGNNTIIKVVTPPRLSYANGGKLPFQTDAWGSYAPTAVGGCSVSSYEVTAGSLPSGLTVRRDTGAITMSGAPLYVGRTGPATITLRDTCDQVATTEVTVDFQTGTPTVASPSQKNLVIGAASRTDAARATGFPTDAVYTVTGASLPAGITFGADRRFSGTLDPSVASGTMFGPFVIRVSDDFGRAAQSEGIYLTAVKAAQITYPASNAASTGQAYTLSPTVTGGATPFTYQLSGTLPAGLTFNTGTGAIAGTPTGSGTASNLAVQIADAAGVLQTSNTFAITVGSTVTVSGTPPNAQANAAYSYTFTASGGQGALTFSSGNTLPAGLSLSTAGVLSGTPTESGSYPLSIVATDAAGRTGSNASTLVVGKAVVVGAWSSWGTGQLGNGQSSAISYVAREATVVPALTSIAVVGDGTTACGIRPDKEIVCWGSNQGGKLGNGGDLTQPAGATASNTPVKVAVAGPWSKVVAGNGYFCGLKGTNILCWGPNTAAIASNGNAPVPSTVSGQYIDVAASPGGNTTCGIRADNSAYCWGALATTNSTFASSPIQVQPVGTSKWARIAPGDTAVCGVQTDGTLWCWGNNGSGQFGSGSASQSYTGTGVRVGTKTDWADVVNNGASICGLDVAGVGYCWGSAANGRLGSNTSSGIYPLGGIAGGYSWAKLSASGDGAMCGVTKAGALLCWGRNDKGQIGSGGASDARAPQPLSDPGPTYSDVAVSATTYALPKDGTQAIPVAGSLWAWGAQQGLGTTLVGDGSNPQKVGSVSNWAGTTGGNLFGCAWADDGTGSCWGRNASGNLGDGTTTDKGAPTAILASPTWIQLAAADSTVCGITKTNKLFCWGANEKGQTGVGNTTAGATRPAAVASSEYFERVYAGSNSFCAIAYGGTLKCWGPNTTGIVGNGTSGSTPVTSPTAVGGTNLYTTAAVGNSAACAIRDSGNLYCWGDNTYGQLMGSGAGITSPAVSSSFQWSAVAAAGDSFCAIRSDGRLFCWGQNPKTGALLGDMNSATKAAVGAVRTATEVAGGGSWASIVGVQGQTAFCGTRTNGTTSCWGMTNSLPNATQNPMFMVSPAGGGMLGMSMGYMNGYGIR